MLLTGGLISISAPTLPTAHRTSHGTSPPGPSSPPGSCFVLIRRCPRDEWGEVVSLNVWTRDEWGEDPQNLSPTSAQSEQVCRERGFADWCGVSTHEVQYHWNPPLPPPPPAPTAPPGSCYVFIHRCPRYARLLGDGVNTWTRDEWGEDPANLSPSSASSEEACRGRGFAEFCGVSTQEVEYHWNSPLPSPASPAPTSPPGSCFVFIRRCPRYSNVHLNVWTRDGWGEDPQNVSPTSAESEEVCIGRGFADWCGAAASEVEYHFNPPQLASPPPPHARAPRASYAHLTNRLTDQLNALAAKVQSRAAHPAEAERERQWQQMLAMQVKSDQL